VEIKNPEMLELIFEAQESVRNIKNAISQKDEIIKHADSIKKLAKDMEKNIKQEEQKLKDYQVRLSTIHSDEIKGNIDTIKKIIESNLPKDIYTSYDEKGRMNLHIDELIEKTTRYEKINVGTIEIVQKLMDIWEIVVVINNSKKSKYNTNRFEIKEKPLRIYKVISYIHDNLSYDE
jgi:hypothetical protein